MKSIESGPKRDSRAPSFPRGQIGGRDFDKGKRWRTRQTLIHLGKKFSFLGLDRFFFVLSSHKTDEESVEHDFDDLYTRANLLYDHRVRLASVHVINEFTTTKLKNFIDFLTEKQHSLQSTRLVGIR